MTTGLGDVPTFVVYKSTTKEEEDIEKPKRSVAIKFTRLPWPIRTELCVTKYCARIAIGSNVVKIKKLEVGL